MKIKRPHIIPTKPGREIVAFYAAFFILMVSLCLMGETTRAATVWTDDFETDQGWALTGEFERDMPLGLGSNGGDPTFATSGSYVLGIDLTGGGSSSSAGWLDPYPGDYDGVGGSHAATLTGIDLTGYTNLGLTFNRWLGIDDLSTASVDIYDGSQWYSVWTTSLSNISDSTWQPMFYDLSQYGLSHNSVGVRFDLVTGSNQHFGWNIDDLSFIIPAVVSAFTRQTPATSPTSADTLVFRAAFSEDVQNVDAADFTITGTTAAITAVTQSTASEYDITVSGGDLAGLNGTVGIDLAGGQNITDLDGNALLAGEPATDETYLLDNTPPAITSFTRQTPATSPTSADTLVFRAAFSKDVQNVDTADFAVTGTTAAITAVTQNTASEYDITVSGGDLAGLSGTVGIDLAGGQNISDLAGNALPSGEPATDETYLLDNTPPAITAIDCAGPSPTNAASVNFTVTFTEPVGDIETGDFALAATGTVGTISSVSAATGSTVTVTVNGITGDGTLGLNFDFDALDSVVDGAGNIVSTDFTGQLYTIDNTAPAVTINQAPTQSDPATTQPISFTAVFDEPVTGFDAPVDVTLSGTAVPSTAAITGSGTTYNVAVGGMAATGTVIADIAAGVAQDMAGNGNTAATFTDNEVNYNPPFPAVISINRADADPTNAASVDFLVTFNQSVSGIDITDFIIVPSAGISANLASVSAAAGVTVTVTVNTITGQGTLGLNLVDDDSITDGSSTPLGGAGANNGDFTGQVYTIDNTGPAVLNVTSATADGTYYIGDSINITVQFHETVTVTGTPVLLLETGVTDEIIPCSAGSGSDTLIFTYTVMPGNMSLDLDYFYNASLALGGGTIRDALGNDAVLTLPNPGDPNSLGANKNLVIDGTPRLLINEIDYNQGATDNAEFIEIINISGSAINLDGYVIKLVDNNGGAPIVYQTINLDDVNLAGGDYYVICNTSGTTVANCDQSVSLGDDFIQDGAPDAVQLARGPAVLDTVSYDGNTPGYTETSGAPADNDTSDTYGLSRFADGIDTNDNSLDFSLHCITPGESNSAVVPPGTCFSLPVVTTQAAASVMISTATGNGTITDLGSDDPTQHGICWSTSANPTIADNRTEEGAANVTGAYTSDMTGLAAGTTYYYRAYATNTAGTSYGTDQAFTTLADTDGDGVPDISDGCPTDAGKVAPGVCGCGVADTDSDGDGTPDCNDGCPTDVNKVVPGLCGCGVADIDSDADGTFDCSDGCPNDADKVEPGLCGCGTMDTTTDTDHDGYIDCLDGCPNDAGKNTPGECGCGVADTDTDMDGTPDCRDGCVENPDKIEPSACGCLSIEFDKKDLPAALDLDGNGLPDRNQEDLWVVPSGMEGEYFGIMTPSNWILPEHLEWTDAVDIPDMVNRPDRFPLGLVSFCVPTVSLGDEIELIIYSSYPIPEGVLWYRYDDVNGWYDYSKYVHVDDDRLSATIEFQDGGYDDADDVIDGAIWGFIGPVLFDTDDNGGTDDDSGNGNSQNPAGGDGRHSSDSGCFLKAVEKFCN